MKSGGEYEIRNISGLMHNNFCLSENWLKGKNNNKIKERVISDYRWLSINAVKSLR